VKFSELEQKWKRGPAPKVFWTRRENVSKEIEKEDIFWSKNEDVFSNISFLT
jgi:hypothetical protein